jgi:hypothetical protein
MEIQFDVIFNLYLPRIILLKEQNNNHSKTHLTLVQRGGKDLHHYFTSSYLMYNILRTYWNKFWPI